MASVVTIGSSVAIRHDRPGSGPAGTLAIVPLECYLLLSVLFPTLSTAGVRIVGNSGIGVYLGFLFDFGASQMDHRCIHVAVVTVPSPYPFLPNLGLLEVHHFPYPPLLSLIRRSRSLPWCILFSLFLFYRMARISYPR